jgi:hypothetical protein
VTATARTAAWPDLSALSDTVAQVRKPTEILSPNHAARPSITGDVAGVMLDDRVDLAFAVAIVPEGEALARHDAWRSSYTSASARRPESLP